MLVSVTVRVNVDNFCRAETHRMFADLQADADGVNVFRHNRAPASLEHQIVIRLNRDTLYSFAVVDLAGGATLTLPDAGDRYLSAMLVNEDHEVRAIHHAPGEYALTMADAGTRYALVALRILVDASDPGDVSEVNALQDLVGLTAASAEPFVMPDYDVRSFDETRDALLALARNLGDFTRMFGRSGEFDPVRHLIGTAAGWGGLPDREASYLGVDPRLPVGRYELTVGEVPVDGFWSISVYNERGFFEPNDRGVTSVNSVTAVRNPDGTVTVRFGDYPEGTPNVIPTPERWNHLVRLYRPRPEILDGSWRFPTLADAAG